MQAKLDDLFRWEGVPSWAILLIGVPIFLVMVLSPVLIHGQTAVVRIAMSETGPTNFLPAVAPASRLLIKFKAPMAQEIETHLAYSASKSEPPDSRVQTWLNQYQLHTLRPLYPQRLEQKKRWGFSEFQMAGAARDRFPLRAQRVSGDFNPPEVLRTYILDSPNRSRLELDAVVEQLRADPDVEFVQLDQVARAQFIPNDPYFSRHGSWGQTYDDLYGLKQISCPTAWDIASGSGVIVAVIDSGIDYQHPDIASQVWVNPGEIPGNGMDDDSNGYVDDVRGWDFVGTSYVNPQPDNDPADHFGHGTHVAGTVAAAGNNNIGVIGVAWGAKVMNVKGLDDSGYGPDSKLANAIVYAADNGADVINASWGGAGTSPVIEDAVNYAASLGVVFVAAAGNAYFSNGPYDVAGIYPASLAPVIAVSALTPQEGIASFSNFGYGLDVSAPGVDILSLHATNTGLGIVLSGDGGYCRLDGTSMAAPHVSGTAALIFSLHPGYTPEEVRQVLRRSADRLMAGSFDPYTGYGRVNASQALTLGPVLESRILSPAKKSSAKGTVAITGIAKGTSFASYTLDYGFSNAPAAWTELSKSHKAVDHAILGALDTSNLQDGLYTIRLRVFDRSGSEFEDRLQVIVNYTFITSPVRSSVPSLSPVYKPGAGLKITGAAWSPRFNKFSVEWAKGFEADNGWNNSGITLTGGGLNQVTNGELATWNSGVVTQADYYTLRLRLVTSMFTNETCTDVYLEPDLYSTNWPHWVDSAPMDGSSVVLARDNAGSNILEMVNPVNGGNMAPSRLWLFPLDGATVITRELNYSYFQPAVADLDGIPGDETVVAEGTFNKLRVFRPDGSFFFPDQPLFASFQMALPTLADLDGDGTPEILAWAEVAPGGVCRLYAWKNNGRLFSSNFPVGPFPDTVSQGHPILAVDSDGNGKMELVTPLGNTNGTFTLGKFSADGQRMNWPTQIFNGNFRCLAAADLDGDGGQEIVVGYSNSGGRWLQVLSADGIPRPGWPVLLQDPSGGFGFYLAIADLDRDGRNEIIVASSYTLDVLRGDGSHFPGAWPIINNNEYCGWPVAGDIDGDGQAEILVTRGHFAYFNSVMYACPSLIAYRANGDIARYWRLNGAHGNQPQWSGGNVLFGDFDGDRKVELAVNHLLISGGGTSGWLVEGVLTLLQLDTPYQPHLRDWPANLHDMRSSAVGFAPATLRITKAGANTLVTWPMQPYASHLENSDDLGLGSWTSLLAPVVTNQAMKTVSVPTTGSHRFFRLNYP